MKTRDIQKILKESRKMALEILEELGDTKSAKLLGCTRQNTSHMRSTGKFNLESMYRILKLKEDGKI